jgi:hypothetical protein
MRAHGPNRDDRWPSVWVVSLPLLLSQLDVRREVSSRSKMQVAKVHAEPVVTPIEHIVVGRDRTVCQDVGYPLRCGVMGPAGEPSVAAWRLPPLPEPAPLVTG